MMLLRLGFLVASTVLQISQAVAEDRPLKNLFDNYRKQPHTLSAPVMVTATAAVDGADIVLKFVLTNASRDAIEIYPGDLPWGNTYSISWVVMTADGKVLPLGYPIDDDFGRGYIPNKSLRSGEAISGTYSLSRMLDAKAIPVDSDLVILWTYDFPPHPVTGEVTEPNPICSGVAFVRTSRVARQQ